MFYRIVSRSKCVHTQNRGESPLAKGPFVWAAKSGCVFRTAGEGSRAAETGALRTVFQVVDGRQENNNPLGEMGR
jgi:hypothetical protein